MRTALFAAICLIGTSASASVQIAGLYNTGVDNSNVLLADQAVDSHYVISTYPGTSGATGSAYTYANLAPLYAFYPGSWIGNTGTSQWIGPAADIVGPDDPNWAGDYSYDLTFTLAGLDPSTAEISGNWASDNGSEIWLNGVFTGIVKSGNGYGSFDLFTITGGFVAGTNTLTFIVNNALSIPALDPNPSGLQVTDLRGTADAATPEPATLIVWSGLLTAAGLVAWRRTNS